MYMSIYLTYMTVFVHLACFLHFIILIYRIERPEDDRPALMMLLKLPEVERE